MSIRVRCEECGKGYRLKPELAGKILPCRECGADMPVPGPRRGRSSGQIRTRGGRPVRRPRERSMDAASSGIPAGVWVGGSIGFVLLLVALGIFLWIQNSQTNGNDSANASEQDGASANRALEQNTWSAPKVGIDNLGEEIAFGPYSLRVPKGWMIVRTSYGSGHGMMEWKWPDESLKSRLTFSVKLDPNAKQGDEPKIITESGPHQTSGPTYIFTGADPPVKGGINGALFYRVDFPSKVRFEPRTHSEYIAILDGARVNISTEVMLPPEMKLCAHAEAAALSFQADSTKTPILTLEQMRQPKRVYIDGFPEPKVITKNLRDWGIDPKHPHLGEAEYAILTSEDDMEDAIVSTPHPDCVAIKGHVYHLIDKGRMGASFVVPEAIEDSDYQALSDDGLAMALAEKIFLREDGKIHLLTDGGKTWKHLQESQSRSRGSLRLKFIRFLPKSHLAAGWRMSPNEEVDVYNLKTGKQTRIPVDAADPGIVAFSPDRRFFAGLHAATDKLVLDLAKEPGEQLTELEKPPGGGLFVYTWAKGLEFSPDCKSVAGVLDSGKRFAEWSIDGDLLADIKIERNWYVNYNDEGPAVQWLADGSGWLIFGRHLVDRANYQPRWSLPEPRSLQNLYIFNRVLSDGRILIARGGKEMPYHFAVYPAPKK